MNKKQKSERIREKSTMEENASIAYFAERSNFHVGEKNGLKEPVTSNRYTKK